MARQKKSGEWEGAACSRTIFVANTEPGDFIDQTHVISYREPGQRAKERAIEYAFTPAHPRTRNGSRARIIAWVGSQGHMQKCAIFDAQLQE